MAILQQGPLGTFTGKIGSIVISKWKNSYVGKNKAKPSSKAATELQVNQRSKFKIVGKFLRSFSDIVPYSFQNLTKNTTAMNEAMRYNLLNSVGGVSPNYTLNYANVKLSDPKNRTEIDNGFEPVMTALPQAKIKISWKMDEIPNNDETKPTDKAYAFFYHPERKVFVFSTRVQRSKLTLDADLPRIFLGEVHGWIFFISEDRKRVSKTEYLGKVTVIA
ncbi:hypothetical protein H7F33_10145 [Pedobacter sp. PAMC26386]|nr:hypothetical protein H7F33_10145 [Pedobacter sp. PAMC26386]